MKVMVIVKATKDSEAGVMPSEELLTAMGNYNEELVEAGIMEAGEGLHPSSKGARVRFSGRGRTVIDGPFAETKELIAGFWIWKVDSMEEAIEWLKKCPNPHEEECELEIRPIFTAEDFGEAFTPELREQEASIRAQSLGLKAPRFEDAPEMTIAGINRTYSFEDRMKIPAQW
ncbi:MAG: YciI family protein, partial [Candidatus Omnitrophica bacterium]|nr:YciI family protein [Candidatus Omnitrophota bacterium]